MPWAPPGRATLLEPLRRKNDIQRVFQEGRRFHSPSVLLHARRRSADEEVPSGPRLTVVAGRQFRTAVARNRARRLLRETSRLLLREAAADWDLVLVARPEVLIESHGTRRENLTRLFRGADVLCERVTSPT